MVIAPASTGRDKSNKMAVIKTAQINKGIWIIFIEFLRILIVVVIKLIAPKIEDTPARCKEKMAKSTAAPLCPKPDDNGGDTVHPVPAPLSTKEDISKSNKAGGRSQNLMLFKRGNAMSGAPNISGTSQFPNPPIITGITIKKIIKNAWAVTITLYNWSLPNKLPGCLNSTRIRALKPLPIIPAHSPNKKYKVPISLWLVDMNHRFIKRKNYEI